MQRIGDGRRKANSCYDDTDSCSRNLIDISAVVPKMEVKQILPPVGNTV